MTPEELKEIKERADEATPGPWEAVNCNIFALSRPLPSMQLIAKLENIGASEDVRFIAHAREDIPKLLAEVEKLTAGIYHADQQFWNQKQATDEFQRKYKNLEQENARIREALSRIKTAAEVKGGTLMKAGVLKLASEALGEGQEK